MKNYFAQVWMQGKESKLFRAAIELLWFMASGKAQLDAELRQNRAKGK